MTQQSVRQAARRAALDAQSKRRRERAEREKRLERIAVDVLVAVRERDASVAAAERRAGAALRAMTDDEGLSLREAVTWCGDEISTREATRLRRLADQRKDVHGDTSGGVAKASDVPDGASELGPSAAASSRIATPG